MAVISTYSSALGPLGMKRGLWAADDFIATPTGATTGTVNFATGFERNIGAGAVAVSLASSVLRLLRIRNTHATLSIIVKVDGLNVGTIGPLSEMTEAAFDTSQALILVESTGAATATVVAYFDEVTS